jgi:tRNA (guanine37-N1)-methyltransferase
MLQFDILTIFPNVFDCIFNESMIKKAQEKKKIKIVVHDVRDYTTERHRKVDDKPFGGGPGMVMQPQPLFDAVKSIRGKRRTKVLLMTPSGKPFGQKMAHRLAKEKNLIIICGHYEGVDERVREYLVDESISIGDYVLTGGEIPAMVIVDSVARLLPGVLGRESSLTDESFEHNLLEYPHYTRPANFNGMKVPNMLLSGNHQSIKEWRLKQSILRTKKIRPDLIK